MKLKEKLKENKNLKTIILIIIAILVITGITYASFNINFEGLINIKTDSPSISLTYEEPPTALEQTNSILTREEYKTSNDYFEFKVSSTSSIIYNLYYNIYLTEKKTNTLSKDNLYIYLTKVDNNIEEEVLEPTLVSSLKKHSNYDNSYIITSDTFEFLTETNETKEITYRLRIWNEPNNSSDSITIKGGIYEYTVNVDTYEPITGLSVIKSQVKTTNISYKYVNGANKTIDGVAYNTDDNGVFLYDGTDDNGGSYPIYYYRGNVTNNNVIFGGFCWKIVRTTSTGGIKLVYNGTPSNGACSNTGTSSQISTSAFSSSYTSPAYVGYMYGTVYEYSSKSPTGTIIYGNDVTYSDGTYTLVDTTTSTSWSNDRTTLANGYHYTCFSSDTTCTSVYYIIYFGNLSTAYYLTFTNGDNLDSAKTKMYTNTTNSTIKATIDDWYKTNLTSYTNYLEDTIFCNDRSDATSTSYSGPLASKDTNNGYSYFKSYENTENGTPSLECTNQNDRFSLSTNNGGTSGYGNNALTYPVGLLTLDEAELAGSQFVSSHSNYYLYTGQYFWVLSPAGWGSDWADGGRVYSSGVLDWVNVDGSGGVRPAVSLQLGTEFEAGTDGSASNPYVVKTS